MKKILFVLLSAAMVMVGCTPEKTTPQKKSYTVTFDMQNHGDQVPSQTVNEGGKVVKPADPTAADFSFSGWYKDTEWKNAWDFDKDIVKSDITLFAKWVGGSVETKTVGWVLNTVDNFPMSESDGWPNEKGMAWCYKDNDNSNLQFLSENGESCNVPLSAGVSESEEGGYYWQGNFNLTFKMENRTLMSIKVAEAPGQINGTYSKHQHADDPVATADEVDVVDPNPDYNAL